MIREPKNVDFYTTGRHLTEDDFAKISEWINRQNSKTQIKIVRSKPDAISIVKRKKIAPFESVRKEVKGFKSMKHKNVLQ